MADIEVTLIDNSDEIKKVTEQQLIAAIEAVGIEAENNAKQEITHVVYDAPESKSGYVRTGRLRNSLTHSVDNSEHAVYVGSAVEYAPYVELGTNKMPGRPYLRPAIVDHIEEYKELIKDAFSAL